MEKGLSLSGSASKYLYHDPCHSPMKTYSPAQVTRTLLGQEVVQSERCCGEAGTFAVSRPDIATQVRFRKQEELQNNLRAVIGRDKAENQEVKLLTACPACQQGLSRYEQDTGLETTYIVIELAKHLLGDNWQNHFVEHANSGGIERVLL